jgi:hypothetical protein
MSPSSADGPRLRLPFAAGAVLLVFCLLAGVTCNGKQAGGSTGPASRTVSEIPPATLLIAASGNDLGFIRPCGCTKPAMGGIDRRAQALKDLRKRNPSLVAVSLGNLVSKGGRQQRIKYETFLPALEEMGYAAVGLGHGELMLGIDYLISEASALTLVPLLAANVQYGGRHPFKGHLRVPGTSLLLVALMPPGARAKGVTIEDPGTVLLAQAAGLKPQETMIVLWSGPEDGARALAHRVPETLRARTLILIGGGYDAPAMAKPETGVALASVGSKGRHIALFDPGARELVRAVQLGEDAPADETVAEMLTAYRDIVRDEKLVESWPRKKAAGTYVGDESCGACHGATCEFLEASAHARAFKALVATADEYDPECVSCHVTGWGDLGGYVSPEKTPRLLNVTCEGCHGPSGEHSDTLGPTPNGKLGEAFCIRCHDPDNSPQIKFGKYWPKIAHPPK